MDAIEVKKGLPVFELYRGLKFKKLNILGKIEKYQNEDGVPIGGSIEKLKTMKMSMGLPSG